MNERVDESDDSGEPEGCQRGKLSVVIGHDASLWAVKDWEVLSAGSTPSGVRIDDFIEPSGVLMQVQNGRT